MPGIQMATNDTDAAPKDTPAKAAPEDPGKAAFTAKLAELRGGKADGKPAFAADLESEGIDVEVKPKKEEGEEPSAPSGEASAPSEGEGTAETPDAPAAAPEALLDALTGRNPDKKREAYLEGREALQTRAEEAGLPPEIAKVLANNADRKVAEKWLDSLASRVESPSAGQPTPESPRVPSGAQGGPASVEVQSLLEGELGEETATAVAGVIGSLEARLAQAEGFAAQAAAASQETIRSKAMSDLMSAAGELTGQFPELVRGDVLHPEVGRRVAAFIEAGVFSREQLPQALEEASRGLFGPSEEKSAPRQASRLTQPDLDAPTDASSLPPRELTKYEVNERIRQEIVRHRAKTPEQRQPLVDKLVKKLAAHNERARRK